VLAGYPAGSEDGNADLCHSLLLLCVL